MEVSPPAFRAVVTVGPPGPIQLVAAPLLSGQVEILAWDSQTRVLAPQYAITHPAEATATAWESAGIVNAAWRDGHVEQWSDHHQRWAADVGFEVLWLLADQNLGVYVFGQDKALLLDRQGKPAVGWTVPGRPIGVLQTMGGDLYVWSRSGLWQKKFSGSQFTLFDPSSTLLGGGRGPPRQADLDGTRPIAAGGPGGSPSFIFRAPEVRADGGGPGRPRPNRAGNPGRGRGLDLRRAVFGKFGSSRPGFGFVADRPRSRSLERSGMARAHLVGVRLAGVRVASGWRRTWPAVFRAQPFECVGQGRGLERRQTVRLLLRPRRQRRRSKQNQVLELFEAKDATGTLLSTWPFANIILLKIARSGITDLTIKGNRVANNWPELRERAYVLLSKSAAPEDRDELVGLVQKEFDPSVAVEGARALAQSGWDGDGMLMRQLYDLLERMPDQPSVADSVVDSARALWQRNGKSTDPVLIPLLSSVYQGSYPKPVKLKAQSFFQDLIRGP